MPETNAAIISRCGTVNGDSPRKRASWNSMSGRPARLPKSENRASTCGTLASSGIEGRNGMMHPSPGCATESPWRRSAHEVAESVFDAPVEGRVGVDHLAQPVCTDFRVHGQGEQPEDLAAGGAHRSGADQHPAPGVLDELDDAVVAGLVDPAAGRLGHPGGADPHVDA